jgi:hypothetical protein
MAGRRTSWKARIRRERAARDLIQHQQITRPRLCRLSAGASADSPRDVDAGGHSARSVRKTRHFVTASFGAPTAYVQHG